MIFLPFFFCLFYSDMKEGQANTLSHNSHHLFVFSGVDANGNGVLYSGITDCARKISKTEGMWAFYKGIGPSYFRQAPHSVLLLVFWDMLKDVQKSMGLKENQ